MAINNSRIIKVPPKIAIAMIAFVVISFASSIYISEQQAKKAFIANYDTETISTLINGDFGGGRGEIGYKKNHFISTSAILIGNKSKYNKWQSNGPIIAFNSEPNTYRLSDLGLPYILSKNANSDTLYVEKEGFVLIFLMTKE